MQWSRGNEHMNRRERKRREMQHYKNPRSIFFPTKMKPNPEPSNLEDWFQQCIILSIRTLRWIKELLFLF